MGVRGGGRERGVKSTVSSVTPGTLCSGVGADLGGGAKGVGLKC